MGKNKGRLIIISGPSGAGKGTIVDNLLLRLNNLTLSVSATTRKMRAYEKQGREYFFVSLQQFEHMIANGEFLEYNQHFGNYYGTPKQQVLTTLNEGTDIILEIDVVGALAVKSIYPQALLFFVMPPSVQELRKRLINRGTETIDIIDIRLERAQSEMLQVDKYDYIILNDDIKVAVNEIIDVLRSNYDNKTTN